ncbi:MAG: hypothetical protein K2J77_12835 [Oscillospiraceae bacterium]|nr:hypothetical protein [Oscillospiraceae bacterium]
MKFFDLENNSISKKSFVEIYSSIYLYVNRDDELENTILEILRNRQKDCPPELTETDISNILKWKTGSKIKDGCVNIRFGRKINIKNVYNATQKADTTLPIDDNKARSLVDKFCTVENIGPVYAITLLYFLSGGKYPIYDVYARIAVEAIDGEREIPLKKNRSNNSPSLSGFNDYNNNYRKKIVKEIFRGEDIRDRKFDRALWAYGHLFYKEK